jgi:hypothetical protein
MSPPMTTKKPPADDRKQVAAFRKAARELGCDESEDRFKDALRAVAKHKPPKDADLKELTELIEKGDPADMERIAKKIGNID